MESIVAGKPFAEIHTLVGKLSDRAARKWYLTQDSTIMAQIDRAQNIENQARQACALRNRNRTWARDLMRDQKKRRELDISEPNKRFEQLLTAKMQHKGLTREQAIEDILKTADKTRKSVNELLGLGGGFMREYMICNQPDEEIFFKQCAALEKHVPNLKLTQDLHDVDDSRYRTYDKDGTAIKVENDFQIGGVFVYSEIALEQYFKN